jgi:adenylate cyclase
MRVASLYFEEMTTTLIAHQATIDKYIGDAIMALWNAPSHDPRHAAHACEAALAARAVARAITATFPSRGWPALRTRFGLHTGEAIVGNVGSRDRMSYTAMGSMVNLASRLEGMNRHYGTEILVSDATRREAGGRFLFRPVDLVLAKGTSEPVEVHELLAAIGTDRELPDVALRLDAWGEMVGRYREGDFARAEAALAEAATPGDPLARTYRARLERLRASAPAGWSPVIRFETK